MQPLEIDLDYLKKVLLELVAIPSPVGFTDEAVRYTLRRLGELGIPCDITRRGAIRADLKGDQESPDRAIVTHLDTIGAIVATLKDNGRTGLLPVGTWSSRFAEGARVTVFCDEGNFRGTILPVKASGHTYNLEIDSLPVDWESVELRVDEECFTRADLLRLGVNVGDYVAVDAQPEITASGFINSRHLDDKGGVATVLAVAKAIMERDVRLPVDCHLLFTISEEVGSGASAVLHGDVAEMVTVDTGPVAPLQTGDEFGVIICMKDSAGPFDYHLTHKLLGLCRDYGIRHQRDVFRHYHSDSASALEAGNDIRTALVCFGTDATHGYERSHVRALKGVADLLSLYLQSPPTSLRDAIGLGPPEGFTRLPVDQGPARRPTGDEQAGDT